MLQVCQFGIVWVVEPARDGHGVVWVEDVRCWRVVNDDCLAYGPAELRQVLDVVALVIVA